MQSAETAASHHEADELHPPAPVVRKAEPEKERRTITLYRMVRDDHVCPFGLKARDLLERKGFEVDDRWLESREATEAFKVQHGVETTPQAFLEGERIGGLDALREWLGEAQPSDDGATYRPVVAVFSVTFLAALGISHAAFGSALSVRAFEWFVSLSMCVLAILKLQDVEQFSTAFLGYDLLAQRWVRYAYSYPYAEAVVGVLMVAGVLLWLAAPLALFIGGVGAVSVAKAVYFDGRDLRCACVGGESRVPLGFVSLTENLMMVAMGIWMPLTRML